MVGPPAVLARNSRDSFAGLTSRTKRSMHISTVQESGEERQEFPTLLSVSEEHYIGYLTQQTQANQKPDFGVALLENGTTIHCTARLEFELLAQ